MIKNHAEKLISYLSYIAYNKFYGVTNQPHMKIDVHLSVRDQEWNEKALRINEDLNVLLDLTVNKHDTKVHAKLSDLNNLWNKLALNMEHEEKKRLEKHQLNCEHPNKSLQRTR